LSVNFNTFLPRQDIDLAGAIIALVVILGLTFVLLRWRNTISGKLRVHGSQREDSLARKFLVYVLYQKPMSDCSRARWFAHFAMFWGFIGLAATTTLDEIINPSASPLSITSPVRILGNTTGVLFVLGVSLSLGFRLSPRARKNMNYGDMTLLFLLLIAGVTGFATEIFSDANLIFPDQVVYWLHIGFVASLLATAPFSKFVHAVGRPILLLTKRMPPRAQREAQEKVPEI
jgi:nitrate reductase gamma subunit